MLAFRKYQNRRRLVITDPALRGRVFVVRHWAGRGLAGCRALFARPSVGRLHHAFAREFRLAIPGRWWSEGVRKADTLLVEPCVSLMLRPAFPWLVIERQWRVAVTRLGYPDTPTLALMPHPSLARALFQEIRQVTTFAQRASDAVDAQDAYDAARVAASRAARDAGQCTRVRFVVPLSLAVAFAARSVR